MHACSLLGCRAVTGLRQEPCPTVTAGPRPRRPRRHRSRPFRLLVSTLPLRRCDRPLVWFMCRFPSTYRACPACPWGRYHLVPGLHHRQQPPHHHHQLQDQRFHRKRLQAADPALVRDRVPAPSTCEEPPPVEGQPLKRVHFVRRPKRLGKRRLQRRQHVGNWEKTWQLPKQQ